MINERTVGSADRFSAEMSSLGFGLGLRSPHLADILAGRSSAGWFEVISENYFSPGGRSLFILQQLRRDYPIALHGTALSVGSVEPLCQGYLKQLKRLIDLIQPKIVSDHLCFASFAGENFHDLYPLPFTQEALAHVSEKISRVQDELRRQILIENVSSYVECADSEMSEWEFLAQITRQTGCGLLVDVNNIYVNSINHSFDPSVYLQGLPKNRVGQIHLAGHLEHPESTA